MKKRILAFSGGLHFQFLRLLLCVAGLLLLVQFATGTYTEVNRLRDQRLNEALGVTNVVARSLEKQFDIIELDEMEQILSSVRNRSDVIQLNLIDAHSTFFLDGDPMTSPIVTVHSSDIQQQALKSAKTSYKATGDRIEVGEPLIANGKAIGAVMVAFENPSMTETLLSIVKVKLLAIVPILLIGFLLAARLIRQITAPLSKLSQTAKAVSEGDLEQQVEPEGALEIRQLGHSFNQMVSTIRNNVSQIYDLAYVDKVTQLPNREYFRKELTKAVAKSKRKSSSGALLFLDLDGFKRVNDTFGHDFGDKLLSQFADRITDIVRLDDAVSFEAAQDFKSEDGDTKHSNTFARLGGDEFTILLPEMRNETDSGSVCNRILESISKPFDIDGKEVLVGASIGIATFPRDGEDYATILKHADMAMYQAKDEGKNTYRFFSQELNENAQNRMVIETDLRKALSNGELQLFYQPKMDITSSSPQSVEALVRWAHPEKGMVQPGDFISIAEDCGLIIPLGDFVLETACKQIREFELSGYAIPISVNISMQQFEKEDFVSGVKSILAKTSANPHLLELEITESMAMSHPEIAISHIEKLKKLGVRFAIDDFGTGYSNLAQLCALPFDVFKIDRSFVMNLDDKADKNGEIIVQTIIAMAHSLNYETVAEGVETPEQMKILKTAGCHVMQGYLFAKPMDIKSLLKWLPENGIEKQRDLKVVA